MNTRNFEPLKYPKPQEAVFRKILTHQLEMSNKYFEFDPLGFPSEDFDINVYEDQQRFKDFLQIRFIEELCEATLDVVHEEHFVEELADAFSFLLTTLLIYHDNDINAILEWIKWKEKETYINILTDRTKLSAAVYNVVEAVGATCNLLKNRPWKQTHYLVDMYRFDPLFKAIYYKFNHLCEGCGISFKRLFLVWSQKYQCNLWRMETKY